MISCIFWKMGGKNEKQLLNPLLTTLIQSKYFIFIFQTHHKQNPEHLDFPHVLFDYHQEVKSGNVKNLSKLKSKGPFINDVNFFQGVGGQDQNYAKAIFKLEKSIYKALCLLFFRIFHKG